MKLTPPHHSVCKRARPGAYLPHALNDHDVRTDVLPCQYSP